MTPEFLRAPHVACAAVALGIGLSASAFAELPTESVGTAPPITAKNRAYIGDIAINYLADGKLHIVDTDTGTYLGVIGSGFGGQYAVNPAKREVIIATGYNSRGQRGERTDVVEVWDADVQTFKYEVIIPPRRAQALNYEGLVRLSADGRWFFVQNATPATSVTVVDLEQKKTAAEIATPGCFGIYVPASRSDRFSTLCGDGTVTTVVLDSEGQQAARAPSAKVFDPDNDAWFLQGEQDGDSCYFVSFLGNISKMNIGGDVATLEETWPLVTMPADKKKKWRPGGYQPLAVHEGTGRLYVAMHSNGAEGSHKNPAEQIWGFDLKSKKRVVRMPGHSAIALEPSPDGKRLYAIDSLKAELVVIDLGAKPKVHTKIQVGANPAQIEAY
jgi:methylamine dehydrogenase heavy chain